MAESAEKSVFEKFENDRGIKTYRFFLLPHLEKLTSEERAEAVQRGVKLYNSEEVEKFKEEYKEENKFTFGKRIKAVINLLFTGKTTDDLELFVIRNWRVKEHEESKAEREVKTPNDVFGGEEEVLKAPTIKRDVKIKKIKRKVKNKLTSRNRNNRPNKSRK